MGAFIELVTVLFSNIVVMISVLGPTPGVSSYPLASQHASSSLPRLLGQTSGKYVVQEGSKVVIKPINAELWSQMKYNYFGSWVQHYFTDGQMLELPENALDFHLSPSVRGRSVIDWDSLKQINQEEINEEFVIFTISSSGKMTRVKAKFKSKDGKSMVIIIYIDRQRISCKFNGIQEGNNRDQQDEQSPSNTPIGIVYMDDDTTLVYTADDSEGEASGSFTDTEKKGEDEEREAEVNNSSSTETRTDTVNDTIKKALGDEKGQIFFDRLREYIGTVKKYFQTQRMTARVDHRKLTVGVEQHFSNAKDEYYLAIYVKYGVVRSAVFVGEGNNLSTQLQVDENGFAYLHTLKE